jgi:molybdate transport system substrate-binding protein
MMLRFLFLCFYLAFLAGCRQEPSLRVAVAANAQYVAQVLKQEFERQTGTRLELIINSSGRIATQVGQGAPYDIFLSADTRYPQALFNAGFTLGPPRVYGYGQLILWTTRKLDLSRPLPDLLAGADKIAIANPESAPYGEAALQVLDHYRLPAQVKAKLVMGDNVAQVNQYVLSGAVDLGFTALSVVLEPAVKGKGSWITLGPETYTPIAQSVVLLRPGGGPPTKAARQFFDFLFSSQARSIFKRFGYNLEAPAL